MTLGFIGLGVVGLVNLSGFAELGFNVWGLDKESVINDLKQGTLKMFEPSLEELLNKNRGHITFTKNKKRFVNECDIIFICVGTPSLSDGKVDLSQVIEVCKTIGKYMNAYKIIIQKSTVLVGTINNLINPTILEINPSAKFSTLMCPEFLREGNAVYDFFHPDRIIVGCPLDLNIEVINKLFAGIPSEIFLCGIESAELIKHASNVFLAMRISFINLMSDLCEKTNANIDEVAMGIGMDHRIGTAYFKAGIGYGGSCLPKEISSMKHLLNINNLDSEIITLIEKINANRISKMIQIIEQEGIMHKNSIFTIYGVTFKENTSDCRNSQIIKLIKEISYRVKIIKFYSEIVLNWDEADIPNNTICCDDIYVAAEGSDALLLGVETDIWKSIDYKNIYSIMRTPIIIDCKNQLTTELNGLDFHYISFGNHNMEYNNKEIEKKLY